MNQAITTKRQMISISHVLGGFIFLFFARKIGDNGIGYIAMILELMYVFLFLVSEEITDFVSKMIRGKKTKGLYKDAYHVKQRVLVIQFITGIFLTLLFFALSEIFAGALFKIPYIGICLRIIAPVIFLKSMETAFLGAFQSSGSQMPTVICALLRQVFFLAFGMLLVGRLAEYGEKVAALLKNEDFPGMYGAIGLCIAFTLSELLIFLFQMFLYLISDRRKDKKRCKEGLQTTEDLRTTLYYYYEKVILIFGSQLFYRLPLLIAIIFSLRAMESVFAGAYPIGSFYGSYLILCSIPVILVEAGTHVMQGRLAYYAGKQDNREVRECIASGLHYCIIFAMFLGVVFWTLSNQITAVFMGGENELIAGYVKLGSVFVITQIMSRFGIGLLKSMNQKRFVLLCSFLGSVVGLITCLVGKKNGFEVYDYMIYTLIFASLVCAISSILLVTLSRRIGVELITTVVVPVVCGCVVGLFMMLISKLMTPHLGNLVCMLLCLVFGFIFYVFLLGLTKNIHEDEISMMYGELGKRIVGLIFR